MAVPTHDQRDFEYAVAHNIPMIQVIDGADVSEHAFEKGDYLGKGCKLINSEEFTGLTVEEAKKAITDKLVGMGIARRKVNYQDRDTGVSLYLLYILRMVQYMCLQMMSFRLYFLSLRIIRERTDRHLLRTL